MKNNLCPWTMQQERNRALLDDSMYMKNEVVSSVPPLALDIEATPKLSAADVALFEGLQIDAARIAIEAVASLSKLNEVDHMGGGLDMIPPLLLTLSLVNRAERDFTIENAHTSAGYYAALAALGYLGRERVIDTFRRGLDIPGHVSWVPGGTQLNGGRLGVLHGAKTMLLQTDEGNIIDTYSVSAGLDYPGVGPEHCHLHDIGRAEYAVIDDDEAIAAFDALCRYEGIIPALESSHAVAEAIKRAPALPRDAMLLVNLSGRGDKDMENVMRYKETRK